jgi:predicted dehydrogenase
LTRLTVGIAGFGVVGERRRKVVDEHPDLELAAIADLKFDAGCSQRDGISYFRKYQDMIGPDLDVVLVALPNDAAPDATIASLKAGCHVFCEKPPGRTVDDVRRVIEAERAATGRKLKYGFNHRYHDSVREALRIARSGELGRIVNMRGVYGKSAMIPWPRPSAPSLHYSGEKFWRTNRAVAGGGILLDQGIHMVDLMRAFAGDFTKVKSIVRNSYWNHDVEDNAYALLETNAGVVAMLHSTATQWRHRFSLEVFLTEGALILSGILSGTKSYGQEQLTTVYRDDADEGNPQETTRTYIRDNSWRDEIHEFVDVILNDRPFEIGNSDEALKTMQLVYDIYSSDPDWQIR